VINITVPPLGSGQDIAGLAAYFLETYGQACQTGKGFSPEAFAALTGCSWPGNVRELEM
jgi:transcriptional regulator with PAS, ATPase and Fis domain